MARWRRLPMNAPVLSASVLASALGVFAVAAGEPWQPKPDDSKVADKVPEQKHERLLADLIARCKKMLEMQTAVYKETVELHKIIEGNPGKQPRREDKRAALGLV